MKVFLRPKNILIIGGSGGIGYAAAQRLLDGGAQNIILASRNINKLEQAKNSLVKNNSQSIHCINFDITNISQQEKFLLQCQKLITPNNLDGLLISSGVNFDGGNWKGFNISENDWDKVMNINLKGVFFLIRNFTNFLCETKIKGNICVVSSISAHRDLISIYQVTKNALSRIVHAYGKYLCERGVVLNCVEPGVVNTEMMPQLKDYTDGIREGKPWNESSIRRIIRPEEIAEIIYVLMSNLGEIMSGSCILCGGGTKALFP